MQSALHINGEPVCHGAVLERPVRNIRVKWPASGSLVAVLLNPHESRLHWMKRRRLAAGAAMKTNLLATFEPLKTSTDYEFYMFSVPEGQKASGARKGLLVDACCADSAAGSDGACSPRGNGPAQLPAIGKRGPRSVMRSPWTIKRYHDTLPAGSVVLEAVKFSTCATFAQQASTDPSRCPAVVHARSLKPCAAADVDGDADVDVDVDADADADAGDSGDGRADSVDPDTDAELDADSDLDGSCKDVGHHYTSVRAVAQVGAVQSLCPALHGIMEVDADVDMNMPPMTAGARAEAADAMTDDVAAAAVAVQRAATAEDNGAFVAHHVDADDVAADADADVEQGLMMGVCLGGAGQSFHGFHVA